MCSLLIRYQHVPNRTKNGNRICIDTSWVKKSYFILSIIHHFTWQFLPSLYEDYRVRLLVSEVIAQRFPSAATSTSLIISLISNPTASSKKVLKKLLKVFFLSLFTRDLRLFGTRHIVTVKIIFYFFHHSPNNSQLLKKGGSVAQPSSGPREIPASEALPPATTATNNTLQKRQV